MKDASAGRVVEVLQVILCALALALGIAIWVLQRETRWLALNVADRAYDYMDVTEPLKDIKR